MEVFIIVFLLLIGPMALLFGAESRFNDVRSRERWWPGHGREKPPGSGGADKPRRLPARAAG
ncbi:MAG TPA: hypothetical protein VKI99_02725 [Candidatus Dormibacteraeota bacterium]|nr:hypothetical protein [Candidatus Dormibacteraeota bacterium]